MVSVLPRLRVRRKFPAPTPKIRDRPRLRTAIGDEYSVATPLTLASPVLHASSSRLVLPSLSEVSGSHILQRINRVSHGQQLTRQRVRAIR